MSEVVASLIDGTVVCTVCGFFRYFEHVESDEPLDASRAADLGAADCEVCGQALTEEVAR